MSNGMSKEFTAVSFARYGGHDLESQFAAQAMANYANSTKNQIETLEASIDVLRGRIAALELATTPSKTNPKANK